MVRPPVLLALLTLSQLVAFRHTEPTGPLGLHLGDDRGRWYQPLTSLWLHADRYHLANNMAAQCVLGAFVEARHGHWRFALVYAAAGAGGMLLYRAHWCLVVRPRVVICVGASPAVYGLMGAYSANLALNWREMPLRWLWLAAAAATLAAEAALYALDPQPHVAYASHVGGALLGVTTGLLVLRNAVYRRHERALYVLGALGTLALGLFALLACGA